MLNAKKSCLLRNRLKKVTYKGDFTPIADAVAKTTLLEQLNVTVEKKDLHVLGKSVHRHPSLKKLVVTGNGEFPFGAPRSTAITSMGRLLKLEFQYIADFLDLILSGTSLTSLHLGDLIYPEKHLEVIGKHLSMPGSTLKELHLDEFLNFGEDFKFYKLAKSLYHNTSLETLSIFQSSAYVMDADLAVFAQLFTHNKTISTFRLDIYRMILDSDNFEKTAGLYWRLTEALRLNPHIKELQLSGFQSFEGFEREFLFSDNLHKLTLSKVIAKAKHDRAVHLQNYRSLSDLIIRSKNLTHLTLHLGADIDIESVRMLADALSKNSVIHFLSLDFYVDQQELAAIIVNGIAGNTTITELRLYDEGHLPQNRQLNEIAQTIVKRNLLLRASLFGLLFPAVDDETNCFASRKHALRGIADSSESRDSKRQRQ